MEVSDEVLKGLDISKNLDDGLFEKLLVEAFHSLSTTTKEVNSELLTSSGDDAMSYKQAHSSLVSLALLFTKMDVTIDEIKEYLTEQNVSAPKVALFTNLYNLNQDNLKYSLASTGFFFPHIVDVSWRADFNTKTHETQDQIKSDVTPKIYIKLICEKDPNSAKKQDIEFRCTIEQLQDLVAKLKDATASLDRLDMYQNET